MNIALAANRMFMNEQSNNLSSSFSRRGFLKTTSAALAGTSILGTLGIERSAHAAGSCPFILALIGCGGRVSGAADQALSTSAPIKLVAVADVFQDHMDNAVRSLSEKHKDKVEVSDDHKFMGFDAYKQAIAAADVVILATPPG